MQLFASYNSNIYTPASCKNEIAINHQYSIYTLLSGSLRLDWVNTSSCWTKTELVQVVFGIIYFRLTLSEVSLYKIKFPFCTVCTCICCRCTMLYIYLMQNKNKIAILWESIPLWKGFLCPLYRVPSTKESEYPRYQYILDLNCWYLLYPYMTITCLQDRDRSRSGCTNLCRWFFSPSEKKKIILVIYLLWRQLSYMLESIL